MRIKQQLLGFCAAIVVLTACRNDTSAEHTTSTPEQAATTASPGACPSGDLPVISGQLHGGISGDLKAMPGETICNGMARPAARGLRLRFQATTIDSDDTLTLIFGIDTLARGDTGSGIRTTVTVIDEENKRFYSTGEQYSCFSDVTRHVESPSANTTQINGVVWCTAAVPELNGNTSIRMPEVQFRGLVQWPEDPV
ncbi:MAG: hypothetical protein AAAFM81_02240 [Pseudomonadota bacterium]